MTHRKTPETYAKNKKQKTIANWKANYNVDIPLDKFENFKQNKKIYLMVLNGEIDTEIVDLLKQAKQEI